MATLLPRGKQQFIDATGAPLVGGKVFHYIPSTTTAKDTYQDANASILNTNPIILDGRGEAVIYGTGSYRQLVQDALGNTIWDQLTTDTSSTNNIWGGASSGSANVQNVLAGNFSYQSGQTITFLATYTNTGALTINGIPVLKDTATGPTNLTGGEVVANNTINVIYEATAGKFHLAIYPIATTTYMPKTGGAFTGSIDVAGAVSAVSPNAGTSGAVQIRDASGNPGAAYLQFTNFAASTGYSWILGRSNGNVVVPQIEASRGYINGTGGTARLNVDGGSDGTNSVIGNFTRAGISGALSIYAADSFGPSGSDGTLKIGMQTSTSRSINATGTINASGADYAEYMVKAGNFSIDKGAICGVNVYGELTNVYADAVTFVVKSTDPSYVGGDKWGAPEQIGHEPERPAADATDEEKAAYAEAKAAFDVVLEAARVSVDRIAFAGQCPVNVTGATPGQYVVPVNDGAGGIAGSLVTSPTFDQYRVAVGRVITIEADGRARIIVKVA